MTQPATGATIGSGRPEGRPRDRFIDFVRVFCMLAVVSLHWVSVMPYLRNGAVLDRNVVQVVPGLWPVTWVGDVMALFFFVGGYVNWICLAEALDRGDSPTDFLIARCNRLLRPTFGFLGLWLALDLLLRTAGFGSLSPLRHVSIGNTIPFGPLWFLGVYLMVVALSPLTIAAHKRWGLAVPVALAVGVAAADAAAFTLDSGRPLAANLLLVWLIPHQLGYFYADGRLKHLSRSVCALLAGGGLVGLAALTSLPYYPRSLVNPRWTVLTFDAPTLSLVAAGVWLIGLALLLRGPLERWLARPATWQRVSRLNRSAMRIYLWHMTAYLVAAATLARLGAGFVYSARPDAAWWWSRPLLLLVSGVVLVGLLWLLRRTTRLARAPGSAWHHERR